MSNKEKPEHWDIIVDAKKHPLNLNLKELWKYRDLIIQFAKRDVATVYNQTILGPLWFLIQPILTTILFMVVFSGIANIKTDPIPSILFYLAGLTIWNYFSTCFTTTSNIFAANSAIFGKVYFPRLIMPVSKIISGLFIFGAQLILFLAFLIYYIIFHTNGFSFHLSPYLLLIPYLLIVMAGLGLGTGIIISSLTTKYRDLTYLVTFGIQLLMYLTPVAYPLSLPGIQGKKRLLILANPMTSVVENFRYAFFPVGSIHWSHLAYSTIFMIISLLFGILIFNRIERNFMDTV